MKRNVFRWKRNTDWKIYLLLKESLNYLKKLKKLNLKSKKTKKILRLNTRDSNTQ